MNDTHTISTTYFIYRPGRSTPEAITIDIPERMDLEELEALLKPIVGGPIEHIPTLHENRAADMFVNEFAHPEGFEINDAATAAFRAALHRVDEHVEHERLPVIKGTAVVFERHVYLRPRLITP